MIRQLQKDLVWLRVASTIAELGTCARRQVGCVFHDARGRVLATGYNGVPAGDVHCIDSPCLGADLPSGEGLDLCGAIHAEQNALIQCKFPDQIHTVYCTASPCIHCVKMLAGTGAVRIVFTEEYPHSAAQAFWTARGGLWEHIPWQSNPPSPPVLRVLTFPTALPSVE